MGTSRLKVILVKEDITIKELAASSSVNYDTLRRIANGRKPHIDNAYDIVDGLNGLLRRKKYHIDEVFPDLYSYSAKKKYKHG